MRTVIMQLSRKLDASYPSNRCAPVTCGPPPRTASQSRARSLTRAPVSEVVSRGPSLECSSAQSLALLRACGGVTDHETSQVAPLHRHRGCRVPVLQESCRAVGPRGRVGTARLPVLAGITELLRVDDARATRR